MNTIIMLTFFLFSSNANANNDIFYVYSVDKYFHEKHINMKIKSYKGWMRVLKSKKKMHTYNIYLDDNKTKIFLQELKKKQKIYHTTNLHINK
jgi:hypothetical protein